MARQYRDLRRLQMTLLGFAGVAAALAAIHAAGALFDADAAGLGIRPRTAAGLIGVVTAPLIHGSWAHLLSNAPALLVLGTALVYGTPRAARIALPVIWLVSGVAVWLFARDAVHIGASGLTYGMLFCVFSLGILRRDRASIALALLVFFLYGSMVWGILPIAAGVSFEYHLAGAVAGIGCAVALRRSDPLPVRPRYDWEGEDPVDAEAGPRDGELFFDRDRPAGPDAAPGPGARSWRPEEHG